MVKFSLNLRGKLIIFVLVGVVLILSSVGAFRIFNERKNLTEQMHYSGNERVVLIAESLANLMIAYDYGNIESLIDRIVNLQDVQQITVFNRTGKIISSRNSADFNPEVKGLVFVAPVNFSGESIGKVELQVSLDRLEKSIRLTYRNVIVALVIASSFFGVLIYASVSILVVRPVLRLGKAAEQLALGDFDAVLPLATQDELGNLVRAFSMMRESRRLSEAKLIAILENSPDALIQLDSDGNIINWNDMAENIFGYRKNDIIGKNFSVVMPDPNLGLNAGYSKCYLKTENIDVIGELREVVGQRKDGSHIYLAIRTNEINFEEGIFYIVSARDITWRKENEAKLLNAMNAAEAANAAKSTFMSNMSHEIRTPMNSIIGMTKLSLKTHLSAKQHDYLIKIDYAAHHLLDLINDILDFAKIEANKLELEILDFKLDTVVKNLSNHLAHSASSKGLHLTFELDSGLSVPLRGDPLRLTQVLLNYTSNAIKFASKGEIVISARIIEEGVKDFLIRFEVQDSGIGISTDQIEKLFQAFHQADASITRKYGGTGLGLVISKQLVELMGGTVGVESQLGQGSTFWFTARLAKGGQMLASTLPASPNLGLLKDASILLVEDNLFNQQVAVEMLREVGAGVTIANNGQEAIDMLLKRRYDCVLMDVQMPVMDGIEATRQIRSTPALADTHIIAMTANAGKQDRALCFAAGMDSFISKPVFPEQLYAIIAQCVVSTKGANVMPEKLTEKLTENSTTSSGQLAPPQSGHPAATHQSAPRASINAAASAVIDLSVLERIMGSDPAKIHKFALKYLSSAQQGLEEIETSLQQENMAALAALGHRNKSPARTVGATAYADLCQSLEQFKGGGDIAQARQIVAQMRTLLVRIAAQIHREAI